MKNVLLSAISRMPTSFQLALCGTMIAGSLSAQSLQRNQTHMDFKTNTENIVQNPKEQDIQWQQVITTETLTNPEYREHIENALNYIEGTKTGQELLDSLKNTIERNDTLFHPAYGGDHRIAMYDNQSPDEDCYFAHGIDDRTGKIMSAEININFNQLRLTGYRHGDKTVPFSLEQVLVHEIAHSIDEINEVAAGNPNEYLENHLMNERSGIGNKLYDTESAFHDYLGYKAQLSEKTNELKINTDLSKRDRRALYANVLAYEDSVHMASEALLNNPETKKIFEDWKENAASLKAIGMADENTAMEFENKFLKELNLPTRTEYGDKNNLLENPLKGFMTAEDQKSFHNSMVRFRKDLGFSQ